MSRIRVVCLVPAAVRPTCLAAETAGDSADACMCATTLSTATHIAFLACTIAADEWQCRRRVEPEGSMHALCSGQRERTWSTSWPERS